MRKKIFTVAIPTFNSLKNLKIAINSVLNQSIPSSIKLTIAISNIASKSNPALAGLSLLPQKIFDDILYPKKPEA